jgi:hypothetical protein
MRTIFLVICLSVSHFASTQTRPDTTCNCVVSYTIKFPDQAVKDKASGTVIVEFEEDENCIWSNPVVIQKQGHGFDEEALRVMKRTMALHNACASKCKSNSCTKRKVKQSFTFTVPRN